MRPEPDKPRPFANNADTEKKSADLSAEILQRYKGIVKERGKNLHSKEHLLADDLSQMMAEPGRFAGYLGIAKLYYESDLRALARYVLEKEGLPIEARGKYFFASIKNLQKRPGAQLKKRKKQKKKRVKNNSNNKRAA